MKTFRPFSVFLLFLFIAAPAFADDVVKNLAGLSFTVPQGWKETPPSSPMRSFQFEIPSVTDEKGELAVFYFGPGQGGTVQANLDRWKGQFTTVTKEERTDKETGGIKFTQALFEGTYQHSGGPMMVAQGDPKENFAVLGAIVEAPQGTIFFKMTGPAVALRPAKNNFDALLASLQKQ